jgi:hypothetical protein
MERRNSGIAARILPSAASYWENFSASSLQKSASGDKSSAYMYEVKYGEDNKSVHFKLNRIEIIARK